MVKKLILTFICIISICSISSAKEVFVLDTGKSNIYIEDTSIQYIGMNENYNIIDTDIIAKKANGIMLKSRMRYYFNVNGEEIKYTYLNIDQSNDNGITWSNINYKLENDINNIHTALSGKSIYSIENAYISNIVYHLYYSSK